MKQSKLMSFIESLINIVFGLGVAMGANAIILPWLGFPISLSQNMTIAAFMTVVSIGRSFLLRRLFEALHIRHPLSPGTIAIIAERRRQIEVEGWTPEHDLAHEAGNLAKAGACYALAHGARVLHGEMIRAPQPPEWPWDASWWKPADLRRNLVKAGALILAELDRLETVRRKGGER